MNNTETARYGYQARFGFSDEEMIVAQRDHYAAHKIACRACGKPATFDSVVRYVCHAHFPPVYTAHETTR